jgi:FkbM family methyltransferase
MKLRNLLELIGIHTRTKQYQYSVREFKLKNDSTVKYATWLHPSEFQKPITDEQVNAYKEFLSPGDFCIDIGAHSGDSTIPMALVVGLNGCALALEPNPFVYHVLEKNARTNQHLVNVKTMMAAATLEEGFIQFEYSDSGFCNGGRHEGIGMLRHGHVFKLNVFGVNLTHELKSDYSDFLPKLKFIKIDAEGYDLYVIKSLSEIIRLYRPCIKTEIFKKTSTKYRVELFSFLFENSYEVFKIDQEPVGRGESLNLDDVDRWKHYDILCTPKESA